MENFVFNLFREQLSRIILDFSPNSINANFLSGRGSINDVRLNVALINETYRDVCPFLEFVEISLSELRIEVTSYTNLKRAPIVLFIGEIRAVAREPLDYRASSSSSSSSNDDPSSSTSQRAPPQQYGLLHRILDNLCVKVGRVELSFSSLGKFKTRRCGPWNPPTLRLRFDDIEWTSITECGNPGPPDAIWAHNDDRDVVESASGGGGGGNNNSNTNGRRRHRTYVIYKRLSGTFRVELIVRREEGEGGQTGGAVDGRGGGGSSAPSSTSSSSSFLPIATPTTLLSDAKIDAHLAYTRRLRDAGVSMADVDVRIRGVDVELDANANANANATTHDTRSPRPSYGGGTRCDLSSFVHAMIGLLHCYYRDRSFVDPLLPDGILAAKGFGGVLRGLNDGSAGEGSSSSSSSSSAAAAADGVDHRVDGGVGFGPDDAEDGPDGYLPEVALLDDEVQSSDGSDYDDDRDAEHDGAYLAWKEGRAMGGGDTSANERRVPSERDECGADVGVSFSMDRGEADAKASARDDRTNDKETVISYERKRKAVIVIASGAQKFEKLSFSLSVPRVNVKLHLPPPDNAASDNEPRSSAKESADTEAGDYHCLEVLLEGLVAECIWPKNSSGEMGGHVQGSMKYCHVVETAYREGRGAKQLAFGRKSCNVERVRPLLRLGTKTFRGHELFTPSHRLLGGNRNSASKCDDFPQMEDKQTTWTWDRQGTGHRALAFKSTISFIDETLHRWSKTNVQHEASLGELEVVLDSAPFRRLSKIFPNLNDPSDSWFDERWLSGEWHAEISSEMIVDKKGGFWLKNHLQPLPALFTTSSSKRSAPSSELRSVTTYLDSIIVRLPNPMQELSSFSKADIMFSISEATILISNHLPSSFLSGDLTPENSEHDFPNDPSDMSSIVAGQSTDMFAPSDNQTKFRMQLCLSDCQVNIFPVMAYSRDKNELAFCSLIAPTNVTVMMSLEHKEAEQLSTDTDRSNARISKSSRVFSVLVQRLETNVELRNIYYALETVHYHVESFINASSTPGSVDRCVLVVAESADHIEEIAILCVHVPDVEILVWGDQTHDPALKKHNLLCRVKAGQFEFGMERASMPSHVIDSTLYKCVYKSLMIEICSRLDERAFKMVEILSFGHATLVSSMAEKACSSSFPLDPTISPKEGFFLRAESESAKIMSSTLAIEIASLLFVDLNISAFECFFNLLPLCLLSRVFVGSSSQIGKTVLGSALMSTGLKVSDLLGKQSNPVKSEIVDGGDNFIFRLSIHRLIVIAASKNESPFALSFNGIEIAAGMTKDIASYPHVIKKNCGKGNRTWQEAFYSLGDDKKGCIDSKSFYVLRLKYGVLRVDSNEIILPASSINWSSPVGLVGCFSAPPFDVFAMKDLILSFMDLGMPFSSLYFKLYKLSPQIESAQDFSLASTRLHDSIGRYHCTMHNVVYHLRAEVDRLRCTVFSKENERVGALAIASSDASGWVRVGEEMNFSHRLFSSSTFWRYWCVLEHNLIILYESPGATPSFIIPLRASSQLRSLALSSPASGIVGEHLRLKGFAVYDSEVGSCLFFVAADTSDNFMWVKAISAALKRVESYVSEDLSSTNMQADSGVNQEGYECPAKLDEVFDPWKEPAAESHSPQVFDDTAFDPTKALNSDEISDGILINDPDNKGALQPVMSSDSDSMENLEMEEISLECNKSEGISSLGNTMLIDTDNFPVFNGIVSSTEIPYDNPPQSSASSLPTQESLPIRERLALKGKSKIASSKLGSALKTAKGSILAASEIGRDSVKQALAKEASRGDEPTKRSLPVAVGQTTSMLRLNANSKLTATLSSCQDRNSTTTGSLSAGRDVPISNSSFIRGEGAGNPKNVIGSKISMLKTVGASVRTSAHDHLSKNSSDGDTPKPSGTSLRTSQDEPSGKLSQDIRKKLINLDQSMSDTMRRLKIDEKVHQFSAAVKSGVMSDPVVRQMNNVSRSYSRNSDRSRQRYGIGEEKKSMKPIKFDARETLSFSSDLPLKIKSSITHGETLVVDDLLLEKVQSLQRIEGSWAISVEPIKLVEDKSMYIDPANKIEYVESLPPGVNPEKQHLLDIQRTCRWEYRIVATEVSGAFGAEVQASVERSTSEVLAFHTTISEMIANHLPTLAELVIPACAESSILQKLSPLDELRISGQLLRKFLDANTPSSIVASVGRKYCKLVELFFSTLLGCHIPETVIAAAKAFLDIKDSLSESDSYASIIGTHSINEAFGDVSHAIRSHNAQPTSQENHVEFDIESDQASSLLNVIMEGYSAVARERDKALANLAVASIINDNSIMNKYLNSSDAPLNTKANSIDEEMLNLCRQLGNEIELRTTAEIEIDRLNDRLKFEQKIAQAKERELKVKLARYEKSTQQTF